MLKVGKPIAWRWVCDCKPEMLWLTGERWQQNRFQTVSRTDPFLKHRWLTLRLPSPRLARLSQKKRLRQTIGVFQMMEGKQVFFVWQTLFSYQITNWLQNPQVLPECQTPISSHVTHAGFVECPKNESESIVLWSRIRGNWLRKDLGTIGIDKLVRSMQL
jgi:hypothetical protein